MYEKYLLVGVLLFIKMIVIRKRNMIQTNGHKDTCMQIITHTLDPSLSHTHKGVRLLANDIDGERETSRRKNHTQLG